MDRKASQYLKLIIVVFFVSITIPTINAKTIFNSSTMSFDKKPKNVHHDPSFWTYRIGAALPFFSQSQTKDGYKKNFNKNSIMPTLRAQHFFYRGFLSLGVEFGVNYYQDVGLLVKRDSDGSFKTIGGEKQNFAILPYHVAVAGQLSQLFKGFLSLDFWAGYEELYWENYRVESGSSKDADESEQMEVVRGWNGNILAGVALGIKLNGLDQVSSRSNARGMGIEGSYISFFYEHVKPLDMKKLLGNRQVTKTKWGGHRLGVSFDFRTL